ncbi:fructosamine kinase family protein [Salinimonas chungwhensis]|uniref:fructosamine kinase family protein n=1 Tax=Salinimonas chungwhensis TaxID=265425 RepID=UPI00037D37D5|nr:fructosamine kinase family protein [Salinimonas chungwhensis]
MTLRSSLPSQVCVAICEHISEVTGTRFNTPRTRPVSGGDSHSACLLENDTARYFVKIRQDQGPYQLVHEADGNHAIQNTVSIRCPTVICRGTTTNPDYEYLVLEYIQFIRPEPASWEQFADDLAHFHQSAPGSQYGWPDDNYIGLSPQLNTQHSCWAEFFAQYRIGAMLNKLDAKGDSLTDTPRFIENVALILADYQPEPAMLHGDLWSGNIGFSPDGPVIFDPAVYVGDRETDIAMTRMFGSLPDHFYKRYYTHYPPADGYRTRSRLYQLYHLLNHALLFGGHYLQASKSAIIDLQKEL